MTDDLLYLEREPQYDHGRLLMGLSGWMDGGDVSIGTVESLVEQLKADYVGEIDPEGFYIYNFPGSMEVSALFRPHVRIENGIVTSYEPPEAVIHASDDNRLLLLQAKEPHLHWGVFAETILDLCEDAGVRELYFVGSVAGMVPHTREPRLRCAVSDESLKPALQKAGLMFTDYEGPGSFTTLLLAEAAERELSMVTLVAEIPAYIQGRNPKGIETVLRKLAPLLELQLDLDPLRKLSDHWEKRIDEAVAERTDLAEHIHKLEEEYDHEVFDTQLGDLKAWLEQQGIQVD